MFLTRVFIVSVFVRSVTSIESMGPGIGSVMGPMMAPMMAPGMGLPMGPGCRTKRQVTLSGNGSIVTITSSFSSSSSGSRVFFPVFGGGWNGSTGANWPTSAGDCWDWDLGAKKNGDKWTGCRPWKYECRNGTSFVIACIGSARTNFTEIPVNSTKIVGGLWHKCEQLGSQVRYSEEVTCIVNGQEIRLNQTFPLGSFKMKCEPWGYSIAGCYYQDTNGSWKELAINQTVMVGTIQYSCNPVPDAPGRVLYQMEAKACSKDGKTYQKGEVWTTRNLRYKCGDYGSYQVVGCVTDNGTDIGINETLTAGGIQHQCYRIGTVVFYHGISCSTNCPVPGQAVNVVPGPGPSVKTVNVIGGSLNQTLTSMASTGGSRTSAIGGGGGVSTG